MFVSTELILARKTFEYGLHKVSLIAFNITTKDQLTNELAIAPKCDKFAEPLNIGN